MKRCGQCDKTAAKLVSPHMYTTPHVSTYHFSDDNRVFIIVYSVKSELMLCYDCRFALNVQRIIASPVSPSFTKRGHFQNTGSNP